MVWNDSNWYTEWYYRHNVIHFCHAHWLPWWRHFYLTSIKSKFDYQTPSQSLFIGLRWHCRKWETLSWFFIKRERNNKDNRDENWKHIHCAISLVLKISILNFPKSNYNWLDNLRIWGLFIQCTRSENNIFTMLTGLNLIYQIQFRMLSPG